MSVRAPSRYTSQKEELTVFLTTVATEVAKMRRCLCFLRSVCGPGRVDCFPANRKVGGVPKRASPAISGVPLHLGGGGGAKGKGHFNCPAAAATIDQRYAIFLLLKTINKGSRGCTMYERKYNIRFGSRLHISFTLQLNDYYNIEFDA